MAELSLDCSSENRDTDSASDKDSVKTKSSPDWEGFRPPLGATEDKARKKARTFLSGLDRGFLVGEDEKTWYHLRVSMLMVFDGPIDADVYSERLERWSTQYPVFRKKIRDRNAYWPRWDNATDFNVRNHLKEVILPAPGGDDELRTMLTTLQNADYDFDLPLWGHVIINGYKGGSLSALSQPHRRKHAKCNKKQQSKEEEYTMLWVSCHHCIGDGTSLGYAISGLLDEYYTHKKKDEASPSLPQAEGDDRINPTPEEKDNEGAVQRRREKDQRQYERNQKRPLTSASFTSLTQSHTHAWKHKNVPVPPTPPSTTNVYGMLRGNRRPSQLVPIVPEKLDAASRALRPIDNAGPIDFPNDPSSFEACSAALADGLRAMTSIDYLRVFSLMFQSVLFVLYIIIWTPRVAAKMVYISSRPKKLFLEAPRERKEVAWSQHISLEEVKTLGRNKDKLGGVTATVNDILTSTLSGAFRRSLEEDGVKLAEDSLRVGIPYNLRAPWDTEIGNKIGSLWIYLPIGIADPIARIAAVKRQMDVLKKSPEALISYCVVQAVGRLPTRMACAFASKCKDTLHGLMTNVRGPDDKCSLLGNQLLRACVFIPHTGNGGFGLTIMSYNGEITVTTHRDSYESVSSSQLMRNFDIEYQHLKSLLQS